MADITKRFSIDVSVLQVQEGHFVALCTLGGIRVRGSLFQDELNAVRNLLIVIGNAQGESDVGLALAINATSIGEMEAGPKELGGAAGNDGGDGRGGD